MLFSIVRRWRGPRLCLAFCLCLVSSQFFTQDSLSQERRPVEELIEMLGSDQRDQRRDAAHALADYGPEAERAIDALIEALNDRDVQIWHDATQALAHLGPKAAPALDALMLGMESGDEQRRFRTAYAIGSIGRAALPAMQQRLNEESGNIREVAVQAIGLMGPDAVAATSDLIERFADKGEHIRSLAVNSLAQIGPATIEPLHAALANTQPEFRAGSAKALAAIGEAAQTAMPKLIALSSTDPDSGVRAATVAALGRIAPDRPEIIEPLVQALQDESNEVKRAAVEAWIPVSPQIQSQATPHLVALLAKQDDTLRTGVLLILNRFGPRAEAATLALLDQLVKHPDSTELTTTLGQIGKSALEPTYAALREQRITPAQVARIVQGMPSTLKRDIARKTNDESPIVRELAASTLGDLVPFPRDGVQLLSHGIRDESNAVRHAAARSTQRIGVKARAVGEALSQAIATESEPDICAIMIRAFAAIRPDEQSLFECLEDNLEHASQRVRETALYELSQLEKLPKSFHAPLSKLLRHPEPRVRALAAESLSLITDDHQRSAELLMAYLDDESPAVRQQSMRSLSRMGDHAESAIKRIQANLDSDSLETCLAAIDSLTNLGQRSNDALPKFKQLAKNGSDPIRKAALTGVRKITSNPEDAVQVLMDGLKDKEWTLRKTAAQELGELEELAAPAIPALLKMMKSEKESDVARRAIREIGTAGEDALPILLEILQDTSSGRRTRYYALYVLRKMGPKAKSALPVLRQLREASDGSLDDEFERTIDEISDEDED